MKTPKYFTPEPFDYHQELEIDIESITNLGIGLGRYRCMDLTKDTVQNEVTEAVPSSGLDEDKQLWVVMVPFVMVGERVKVRIYRNHKNYSDADLIEVLKPSPDRTEPVCPLYTQCSGCQYQHVSYEHQLTLKTAKVKELLDHQLDMDIEVKPAFASPEVYGYRSKITPHFLKPKIENFQIGFLKQGQRRHVIDVEQCPIATKAINEALPQARIDTRASKKSKKGGTLLLRDAIEGVISDNNEAVSQQIGKNVFHFNAGEFFQNNPFILPHMVDYVLKQAKGKGITHLVDTYCGVGVFSIAGSPHFEECIGVEINQNALFWCKGNAKINRAENCRFIYGNAEAIFDHVESDAQVTSVIIDPPRKGCDAVFLDQLVAFKPKRIVYVSCDPATQARDLKPLIEAGYRIEEAQPFDLFPQTRHIENVVTLSL